MLTIKKIKKNVVLFPVIRYAINIKTGNIKLKCMKTDKTEIHNPRVLPSRRKGIAPKKKMCAAVQNRTPFIYQNGTIKANITINNLR